MPAKASLNVSLTPELMAYVASQVESGQYRSASEVLRAGLRLLQRVDAPSMVAADQLPGAASSNSELATRDQPQP